MANWREKGKEGKGGRTCSKHIIYLYEILRKCSTIFNGYISPKNQHNVRSLPALPLIISLEEYSTQIPDGVLVQDSII